MSNYTSSPGAPSIPLSINELPLRPLSTHAIIDKGVLDFFSATIVLYLLPRYAIKNMKLEKRSMTCRGAVLIVVAVIKYDPNSHIDTVFDQFSETFKKLRVSARKITLGMPLRGIGHVREIDPSLFPSTSEEPDGRNESEGKASNASLSVSLCKCLAVCHEGDLHTLARFSTPFSPPSSPVHPPGPRSLLDHV